MEYDAADSVVLRLRQPRGEPACGILPIDTGRMPLRDGYRLGQAFRARRLIGPDIGKQTLARRLVRRIERVEIDAASRNDS